MSTPSVTQTSIYYGTTAEAIQYSLLFTPSYSGGTLYCGVDICNNGPHHGPIISLNVNLGPGQPTQFKENYLGLNVELDFHLDSHGAIVCNWTVKTSNANYSGQGAIGAHGLHMPSDASTGNTSYGCYIPSTEGDMFLNVQGTYQYEGRYDSGPSFCNIIVSYNGFQYEPQIYPNKPHPVNWIVGGFSMVGTLLLNQNVVTFSGYALEKNLAQLDFSDAVFIVFGSNDLG